MLFAAQNLALIVALSLSVLETHEIYFVGKEEDVEKLIEKLSYCIRDVFPYGYIYP